VSKTATIVVEIDDKLSLFPATIVSVTEFHSSTELLSTIVANVDEA